MVCHKNKSKINSHYSAIPILVRQIVIVTGLHRTSQMAA